MVAPWTPYALSTLFLITDRSVFPAMRKLLQQLSITLWHLETTKASKRCIQLLLISGEAGHCKTSKQLLGSSTDESHQQSLQTKSKCYLLLSVCSILSQCCNVMSAKCDECKMWWVQFVETVLPTSQTNCKGTNWPSDCHLRCLRPVQHNIKIWIYQEN